MIALIAIIAVYLLLGTFLLACCRAARTHEVQQSRKHPVIGKRYD